MPATQPLLVLLLPTRLEAFDRRAMADELLLVPAALAVEPPRVSYQKLDRLPRALGGWLAFSQAKRMKLPGTPGAVVLFDPLQYSLARGMLVRHPGCELWYGPPPAAGALDERVRELHQLALERAAITFEDTEPLWERMQSLGIA